MPKGSEAERTPVTRVELKRVGLMEWVDSEDRLQSSTLLCSLSEQAKKELLAKAGTRRFNPKSSVFDVGDSGASLFFLLRGEVRQLVRADSGVVEVSILHAGDFFGEDVVLTPGSSRQCAAFALGEVDVAEFPAAQLIALSKKEPRLLPELQRVHRLRQQAQADMLAFLGRW